MRAALIRILSLMLLFSVTACGDLPEPFLGNPGATARRLAKPLAARLAVPVPSDTLLPDSANKALADDLATALQMEEVPAMAQPAAKSDWQLVATAAQQSGMVVPKFVVLNPQGKTEGEVDGAPVPVADWGNAGRAMLRAVAVEATPRIAATLTSIRIARDRADPNSLYNRAAKVMVAEVTGAPGDGDQSLTRQMRAHLATLGPVVQTTPAGADFMVKGQVKIVPEQNHLERVEIQWIITAADGSERGRVVQLNEIPSGTLDHYWGDVAAVVATEASGGVNDVIRRQSGHAPDQAASTPVTTEPAAVRGGTMAERTGAPARD
jgi:hypothetical protein